jgi:hypothetical protein
MIIIRGLATVLWLMAVAVLIPMAVISGLLVTATALMVPAVRWLAIQSEK